MISYFNCIHLFALGYSTMYTSGRVHSYYTASQHLQIINVIKHVQPIELSTPLHGAQPNQTGLSQHLLELIAKMNMSLTRSALAGRLPNFLGN